jgi:phosphotransferase system IIA component
MIWKSNTIEAPAATVARGGKLHLRAVGDRVINNKLYGHGVIIKVQGYRWKVQLDDGRIVSGNPFDWHLER